MTVGNLNSGEIDLDGANRIGAQDFAALDKAGCRPRTGDVLFSKDGSVGKVALVRADGFVVLSSLAILRPKRKKLESRFLTYVLESPEGAQQIHAQYVGAALRRITLDAINELELPVPQLKEQAAIARFLDHETARIDELIAKQERLIELLKEKRQAVVSHAVTKGLNPDAPMKDSGVEWLGEVPAHWVVGRLKVAAEVTDCKHVTADFVDDGIPLVSIREVQSWFIDIRTAKRTTPEFAAQLSEGERELRPGDIVYSRNATVGQAAMVPPGFDRVVMGQDVCRLRLRESLDSPEFLLFQLRSRSMEDQLGSVLIGSTFKRINVDTIKQLWCTWPPTSEEQRTIVKYLEAEASKYVRLLTAAHKSIELMQERRTALISAAVTGKIDVRDWQPPSYAADEAPADLPMAAEESPRYG